MRFTNLTRATEIGANSYLLELADHRFILDAGMHPTRDGEDALPDFSPVADGTIDAIFLTHAHLDHVGSLPIIMRQQRRAPVFMTAATARLGEIALHNSVNVMSRQENGSAPMFTHRQTDAATQIWQECGLGQPFSFDGERLPRGGHEHAAGSFELFDAGHILGSAGVLFRGEGRNVFYTGDVNFADQTISRAAGFPAFGHNGTGPLDVLIIETTRGDAPTLPGVNRASEEQRFGEALRAAFARGGAVLVPVFALGKTQELLAVLMGFRQKGLLSPDVPIYIGGLGTKMTETYDRFARGSSAPRRLPGVSLLDVMAPYVLAGKDAADQPIRNGRIYALSGGMMTAETLSNKYARRMLGDPKNSVLFVGYADPLSPAGRLLLAAKAGDETVRLDDDQDVPVPIRATVDRFDFSAHADREGLLGFILRTSPRKVVLVHGDPGAVEWFRDTLRAQRPEIEVVIPTPGVGIDL